MHSQVFVYSALRPMLEELRVVICDTARREGIHSGPSVEGFSFSDNTIDAIMHGDKRGGRKGVEAVPICEPAHHVCVHRVLDELDAFIPCLP
jgi:hypothetical protein